MKKFISYLLSIAMLLSLGSISVMADSAVEIPMNGDAYRAEIKQGTDQYYFTVPATTGVTDVSFYIDNLPLTYTVEVDGNGIQPVKTDATECETLFTVTSLKSGTYNLYIKSGEDSPVPEEGSTYRIFVEGTMVHASNNESDPTPLTNNTYFHSNLYTGRVADYYTFTIAQKSNVTIDAGAVPPLHNYTMELYGNGLEPIVVTDVMDFMTIQTQLDPGQYFIAVQSDWRARTEPFETWYGIRYTATEIN